MRMNLPLALCAAFLLVSTATQAADLAAGEKVFKKCFACHTLEPGKKKVGPSLHGIVGRKSAEMKGFSYSKAMREADVTWNEAALDKYLENPRGFIKGNRMSFPGLKNPQDRENVIAYIKEKGK